MTVDEDLQLHCILKRRAAETPDAVAYRFFTGPQLTFQAVSYGELLYEADARARQLRQMLAPRTPVLLVCKAQRNFVAAFFACLLADMIAVPTALPRRAVFRERIQALASDARIGGVILDSEQMAQCELRGDAGAVPRIDWRDPVPVECLASRTTSASGDGADLDRIALLQYTSGSTGDPKGVMISHRNLVRNSAVIQEAMGISSLSSVFTALPMFHDMGLVGGLLQPMFSGCAGNWMSPPEFVQYPERWLQIMSKFRITVSGGPNFMYRLAARNVKLEDVKGLDLSSWEVAFCGAEQVRASTIAEFTTSFESIGFKPAAFYPCYGMAESTLFITGKRLDARPRVRMSGEQAVVSCGVPRQDTVVRIVDPVTTCVLNEREVGEIWVSGSSVAQGYWGQPELNRSTYEAQCLGEGGHFLRTGDLGYRDDDELFVTGRLKDLLIVHGKKYAPQDIEDLAESCHAALCESGSAAFTIVRNEIELPVLLCELRREWLHHQDQWPQISAHVKSSVYGSIGVALHDVAFIRPGALARTTSGKLRRSQCRADYLGNKLQWADSDADRVVSHCA